MTLAQKIAYFLLESLVVKGATSNPDAPTDSPNYCLWVCDQIINNPEWDEDEAHRWVGYVQGIMVAKGLSTVEDERQRVVKAKRTGLR